MGSGGSTNELLKNLVWSGADRTSSQMKLTQVHTKALCKGLGINEIWTSEALQIKYRTHQRHLSYFLNGCLK
jgi:hypothetical protein